MVPPRHHPGAGRPGALSSSPPFRLRSAKFSGIVLQDLRKAFKIRLQMVCVFIMNRMNSQSSGFTQRKRMALGIVILLLVDVIWVASSELTSHALEKEMATHSGILAWRNPGMEELDGLPAFYGVAQNRTRLRRLSSSSSSINSS